MTPLRARVILTVLALATLAIGVGLMSKALAHSWYDPFCCNSNDCQPISPDDVVAGPTGFVVTLKGETYTVPYGSDRIRQSQDGDFHACEYPKGTLRCFYVPGRGV